jgi:hypothetical protein
VRVGGRGHPPLVLPWAVFAPAADPSRGLRLVVGEAQLGPYRSSAGGSHDESRSSCLWLGRDVLDSQVVDLSGSRLARVSEIYLLLGTDDALVAFAVDLGLGALLIRLGLGRISRHLPEVAVAWDDLYLASAAGHHVELTVSAQRLRRLDPSTMAEIIARLRTAHAADVLRAVEPEQAAAALATSHDELRRGLVRSLSAGHEGRADRRFLRTSGWRVRRPKRAGQ